MPWTFYSATGQRLSTAATSIAVLDIDGATDIGAAIVDADLFIIDDGAGGTNRKTAASRIVTYVGANAAASQAEMEAASSNTVFATPGRTHNHPGVAKGWCTITAAGALSSPSYNISSVTDTGTGSRVIIFDTDFSSVIYSATAALMTDSNNDTQLAYSSAAAGQIVCQIYNSGSLDDRISGHAFFGDQ